MNRRAALAIAFIGFNLMACCCGGVDAPAPGNPAPVSKINRANYNRLANGISVEEAQQVLGPGKEDGRAGDTQIITWSSDQFPVVIISATFRRDQLVSKNIVGD